MTNNSLTKVPSISCKCYTTKIKRSSQCCCVVNK
uniref:Uncharacterized protein n=1 Tax=Arundo donax TaxID=35708 RepID=A0A0A9FZA9_ARUDO